MLFDLMQREIVLNRLRYQDEKLQYWQPLMYEIDCSKNRIEEENDYEKSDKKEVSGKSQS